MQRLLRHLLPQLRMRVLLLRALLLLRATLVLLPRTQAPLRPLPRLRAQASKL